MEIDARHPAGEQVRGEASSVAPQSSAVRGPTKGIARQRRCRRGQENPAPRTSCSIRICSSIPRNPALRLAYGVRHAGTQEFDAPRVLAPRPATIRQAKRGPRAGASEGDRQWALVATSSVATPDGTVCSAQCSVPWPMRKNSTATTTLARHSAALTRSLPAARPRVDDQPGDEVPHAGGHERRNRFDRVPDGQVRRAPDDVDGEEGQEFRTLRVAIAD